MPSERSASWPYIVSTSCGPLWSPEIADAPGTECTMSGEKMLASVSASPLLKAA